MVGLDALFALQNVRPDGALGQELNAVQLPGFLGEDLDKFAADDFSLLLGLADACQLVKEPVGGIHIDQIGVHLVAEDLNNLLGLTLAQQTVVYVDANQLLANGLDQHGGNHRGIHAAAECQQDLLIADLRAQSCDLLLDECLSQRGGCNALHIFGTSVQCHMTKPPCFFFWHFSVYHGGRRLKSKNLWILKNPPVRTEKEMIMAFSHGRWNPISLP